MSEKKNGKDLARKSSFNAGDPVIRPFIGDKMVERGIKNLAHLATNESQYPLSEKVVSAMIEAIHTVNLYPDPSSTLLRRKIAKQFGITEKMVTVGNGADELLYMIGKAFIEEGENAVISVPCYPTEVRGIESMGGIVKGIPYRADFTCDIEAMFAAIDDKTKLVLLCTPGNPNTTIITQVELDWFMERVPAHILVVMDEAYKEFINVEGAADAACYFQEDRNIIFLRTFSKFYGLAGLRVGYALGPEHIIETFRRSIPSFPVNVIAQAAAMAAMDDTEYYDAIYKDSCINRDFLTQGLLGAGFKPAMPSQTNFLFVDTCHIPRQVVLDTFFDAGFYIFGAYGAPYESYVRIAVGTMEQCIDVIAVAKKLCEQYSQSK